MTNSAPPDLLARFQGLASHDRMDSTKHPTLHLSFSYEDANLFAELRELNGNDVHSGRVVARSRLWSEGVDEILAMPELLAARHDPRAIESDERRLLVGEKITALLEGGETQPSKKDSARSSGKRRETPQSPPNARGTSQIGAIAEPWLTVAQFLREHAIHPRRLLVDVSALHSHPISHKLVAIPWEMLVLRTGSGEPFALFSSSTLRTTSFQMGGKQVTGFLGAWKLQRLVHPTVQRSYPLRTKLRVLVLLGEHEVQTIGGAFASAASTLVRELRGYQLVVAGTPLAIQQAFGAHHPEGVTLIEVDGGRNWQTELFGGKDGREHSDAHHALVAEPFHVLCFLGHSQVVDAREAGSSLNPERFRLRLSLQDGPRAVSLSLRELSRLLERHAVRVALLCACDFDHAFVQELLDQVEHVIAGTCKLPPQLALQVSEALFPGLAQLRPIGDALQQALTHCHAQSDDYAHADWALAHWSRTIEDRPFASEAELEIGHILDDLRASKLYNSQTLRGQNLFGVGARNAGYVPLRLRRRRKHGAKDEDDALQPTMNINALGRGAEEDDVTIDELVRGDSVVMTFPEHGHAVIHHLSGVKLIESAAGYGKSTLLRHLAWRELDASNGRLPILIPLGRWGKKHGSFIRYFASWLIDERRERQEAEGHVTSKTDPDHLDHPSQKAEARIIRALREEARSGRVLFLLDGVDELAHPTGDAWVHELLTDPINETVPCIVIAASRPGHKRAFPTRNDLLPNEGLDVVHIHPSIQEKERQPYLESILGQGDSQQVEILQRHLKGHAELDRIANNAFVLCLCALVWHTERADKNAEPNWISVSQLYQAALEEMLSIGCSSASQNEIRVNPPQGLDADSVDVLLDRLCPLRRRGWTSVLEDLAWEALGDQRRGDVWRDRKVFSKAVVRFIQDLQSDMIDSVLSGTSIRISDCAEVAERVLSRTRIVSVGNKDWEFVHRSFAEFLTARWFLREENRARAFEIAKREVWEAEWEVALQFYCELAGEDERASVVDALVLRDEFGVAVDLASVGGTAAPAKRASVASLVGRVGSTIRGDPLGLNRVDPRLVHARRWVQIPDRPFLYRLGESSEWEKRALGYKCELQRWPVTEQEFGVFVSEWNQGGIAQRVVTRELSDWEQLVLYPSGAQLAKAVRLDSEMLNVIKEGLVRGMKMGDLLWDNSARPAGNRPAVRVTWYGAWAYCLWLSARLSSDGCGRKSLIRLPWDDEWQSGARMGDKWSAECNRFDSDTEDVHRRLIRHLQDYPWCGFASLELLNCSSQSLRARGSVGGSYVVMGQTSPVGIYGNASAKESPGVELYDMSGNVLEWVCDRHDPSDGHRQADRVMRGGSFVDFDSSCRISTRKGRAPGISQDCVGFRPVRVPAV